MGIHALLITLIIPADIPVTAANNRGLVGAIPPVNALADFIEEVSNGDKTAIVGIYAPYTLALPVVDQPADNSGFIAVDNNVVTRYQLADEAGSIGMLAHYEYAGKSFYRLKEGQVISLVYGDGHTRSYSVKQVVYFQAKDPAVASTDFISLDLKRQEFTQSELFDFIYRQPNRLVLQTCLATEDTLTWGRMFVIAEPMDAPN